MDEVEKMPILLASAALGLMMGLERELRGGTVAGLRTFGLVSITGSVTAMLTQEANLPWLIPAVALGLVLMAVSADRQRAGGDAPPDTTTTVALLLCYAFGAMLMYGHLLLTVALALGVTALLYFKAELHGVAQRLTRQDVVSVLQFLLLTFVVLPVLPDQGYGPYDQLNPFRIWLMVVLTSGLSLAGYIALRLAPRAQLVPLLGVLGGLVSSTATTLVFARQLREDPRRQPAALAIILIANLVLLLRIAVLAAVLAPALLRPLAPVLVLGLVTGTAWSLRGWLGLAREQAAPPTMGNPADLRHALVFGAIYGVVLLTSAVLHDQAGAAGVYTVAAVSGLADMDALAISSFHLHNAGHLDAAQVSRAVVIAFGANLVFKNALVLALAGRAAGLHVALNYAAVYAGLLAGLAAQAAWAA